MSPPTSPSKLVEDHTPQGSYVDYTSIGGGNLELTDLTKDFDFDLTDVDVAAFENVANEVSIPSTSLVITSSSSSTPGSSSSHVDTATSSSSHLHPPPPPPPASATAQSSSSAATPTASANLQTQTTTQVPSPSPSQTIHIQQHVSLQKQQHVQVHLAPTPHAQHGSVTPGKRVLGATTLSGVVGPTTSRQIIMVPASALISAKTHTGATATFLKVTGLTPKNMTSTPGVVGAQTYTPIPQSSNTVHQIGGGKFAISTTASAAALPRNYLQQQQRNSSAMGKNSGAANLATVAAAAASLSAGSLSSASKGSRSQHNLMASSLSSNVSGSHNESTTFNKVDKQLMVPENCLPSAPKRKGCNCSKSQCLKLYCDCFANGEFCSDCNCNNCFNNLEHEEDRQKAIRQSLDRNPQAFHPKIGKTTTKISTPEVGHAHAHNHAHTHTPSIATASSSAGGHLIDATTIERRHVKGCNCKRSGCLKNYCECYEAKILCSNLCKCCGCKNYEESFERKNLMHLSDITAATAGSSSSSDIYDPTYNHSNSQCNSSRNENSKNHPNDNDRSLSTKSNKSNYGVLNFANLGNSTWPCSFINNDVIQATSQCLIAQADEGETKKIEYQQLEHLLIEEFGKCLTSIIETAAKSKKKAAARA